MKSWEQKSDVEKARYIVGDALWEKFDDTERLIAVAFVQYGTPRQDGFDTPAAELGHAYDTLIWHNATKTAKESRSEAKENVDYLRWYAQQKLGFILFENDWMQFETEEAAKAELGEDFCGGYCEYTNEETGEKKSAVVAIVCDED